MRVTIQRRFSLAKYSCCSNFGQLYVLFRQGLSVQDQCGAGAGTSLIDLQGMGCHIRF